MHRHLAKTGLYLSAALLITSCVSAVATLPVAPDNTRAWSLETALPDLRAESCPAGTIARAPLAMDLTYNQIDTSRIAEALPAKVSLLGVWHVTSDNANWGGVSGIDYSETGDLVAVSDRGALFQIPVKDNQPETKATLTYLLDGDGKHLSGKILSDSEGLALYQGTALISFERDHRIDLYDIQSCGAAARPARLATLPDTRDGQPINANRGAEALAVSANGTVSFAYEQPAAQSTLLGVIGENAQPEILATRIATPLAFAMVGRDHTTLSDGREITADLLRSYDPIRGLRTLIRVDDIEIALAPPMPIDNFEGIALQPQSDGSVIVWIISDNNFNADQRTLLFAFRIAQK